MSECDNSPERGFEMSGEAAERIRRYFDDEPGRCAVRIVKNDTGCCGSHLGLITDAKTDNDAVLWAGQVAVVVDRDLLSAVGPIRVDHSPMGFFISSSLNPGPDTACERKP